MASAWATLTWWEELQRGQDFRGGTHIVGEQQQGGHIGLLTSGLPVLAFSHLEKWPEKHETNATVPVSLHYWAGARAAAGVGGGNRGPTVAEALRLACDERSDPHFDKVIQASSVLIDGLSAHQEDLTATQCARKS